MSKYILDESWISYMEPDDNVRQMKYSGMEGIPLDKHKFSIKRYGQEDCKKTYSEKEFREIYGDIDVFPSRIPKSVTERINFKNEDEQLVEVIYNMYYEEYVLVRVWTKL